MLNRLSYLNLLAAPLYVVVYLRGGSPFAALSIVGFVIINWLALLSEQRDNYRWHIHHYVFGIFSLVYAIRLLYGAYQAIAPAIEYKYMSMDNFWYVFATIAFCATTIWQVLLFYSFNRNQKPKP